MLYAIGDLHFSNSFGKPMDIFGQNWANHQEKIINNWKQNVKEQDTVILLGDTSWAMHLKEAMADLEIINSLPGEKILIKGNHDYWWNGINRLNKLYDNMKFIQNSFYTYKDYAICGSRGWLCPNDVKFDDNDKKLYERETIRLRTSLEQAKYKGYENIIIATHYPPTNDKLEDSNFTKLYEEYKVKKVLYGHLHGEDAFKYALIGNKNEVEYDLTSCDYTDFKLMKIID